MGGEGVVVAQHINESENRGYGIQGVVSIAPTHYQRDIVLKKAKHMQLFGSLDLLASYLYSLVGPHDWPDSYRAVFSGFRIYDRAWRPKSHFWIYGARHNAFNRRWLASGDDYETGWANAPSVLSPNDHERLAKCLINAFFQDVLFDKTAYAGYMEGTILPHSLYGLSIHAQHSEDPKIVLDNFGNADEQQAPPLVEEPLDKSNNSLVESVVALGAGLGIWKDVEHTNLSELMTSPHETKGVQLSWSEPNALYTSNVGGQAVDSGNVLSLRIAQVFEDVDLNPENEPVDLFVTIGDDSNEATIRLGAVAQVPFPAHPDPDTLGYTEEDTGHQGLSIMRTVRLPLDAFQATNPGLNIDNIQFVTLRLVGRATGNILVDDLEFSN